MRTIFEALESTGFGQPGATRASRPGAPVRRHSRTMPGGEGRFWRPFNPKHRAPFMLAAERYDCAGRLAARADRNGRKNGPLGHVALDVLRELLRVIDYRTGRLDPAIKTIAQRIGRSTAAVVDALKRLRLHGFLDWLRRYEPTNSPGRGPQVRQTSNAYRVSLPPRALALLPDAAPVSDDLDHADQQRDQQRKEYAFDDSPLAGVFARWGAAVARRERDSDQQHESIPSYIYKGATT